MLQLGFAETEELAGRVDTDDRVVIEMIKILGQHSSSIVMALARPDRRRRRGFGTGRKADSGTEAGECENLMFRPESVLHLSGIRIAVLQGAIGIHAAARHPAPDAVLPEYTQGTGSAQADPADAPDLAAAGESCQLLPPAIMAAMLTGPFAAPYGGAQQGPAAPDQTP